MNTQFTADFQTEAGQVQATGLILSIDIGTQSTRAMAFNEKGQLVCQARALTPPYLTPQPGWAELPARVPWETLCQVTRDLVDQLGDRVSLLQACAVTAQRDNLLAVDEQGEGLYNWILWMDQRRTPEAAEQAWRTWRGMDRLALYFKRSLLTLALTRSKFNWLKFHQPEVWKRAHRFLTMGGYITYRLTGQFHDSLGMQSGVLPFEVKKQAYYRLGVIHRAVGVTPDRLAHPLFKPGQCMGKLTAQAALETGLPEGLPIIAAGGDKQSETLGAGGCPDKVAVISYGTMASLTLTTARCIRDSKFTFYTFPATLADHFCEEFLVDRGYWLVNWFCQQYAREGTFPPFLEEMNRQAEQIPPGSNGLFVFPFWTPHYVLYPEARGGILGFTDDHEPAHLYRAILESLAYTLRWGLAFLERRAKIRVEALHVVGGGSRSPVALQLTADVFNRPVVSLKLQEAGGVGAAIPAALYAGFFKDEESALAAFTEIEAIYQPQPQAVAAYEKLYQSVYLHFYQRNLPLFRRLAQNRQAFPFVRPQGHGFEPLLFPSSDEGFKRARGGAEGGVKQSGGEGDHALDPDGF